MRRWSRSPRARWRPPFPARVTPCLKRGTVIREKRATFSLAPGEPARPGVTTPIDGLFLAGDWIDTGLPGTIESAAVAGHLAAARQSAVANQSSIAQSMKSVIIHYQEIALKGKNRPWFVARLVRNIREATRDLDIAEVRVLMGRIELVLGPDVTWEQVRDRLALVFGIGNFARAGRAPLDVDAIAAGDPERPRSGEPGDVPRLRQARRQALSLELAGDRAGGRRTHQGSAQLDASTSAIRSSRSASKR